MLSNSQLTTLADRLEPELVLLDNGLKGISQITNVLPLVNKSAREFQEITNTFGSFKTQLLMTLRSLGNTINSTDAAAVDAIRTAIFSVMSDQLHLLTDTGSNGLDKNDVDVVLTSNSVHVGFDLGKTFALAPDFGLGLAAVPFKTTAATPTVLALTMALKNFNFGYSDGGGFDFLGGGVAKLNFTLVGDLPGAPGTGAIGSALLGFLDFDVRDLSPTPASPTASTHDLSLTISADVALAGISNVKIQGNAAIHLGFGVHVDPTVAPTVSKYLPKIRGELDLDWNFVNVNAAANLADFGTPVLKLHDVQVNVRGVLDAIAGPLVGTVSDFLRPIQPILEFLDTPVPGLSDLMQSVGLKPLSVIQLAGLFDLGSVADDVVDAIESADKVIHTLQTIQRVIGTGTADDAWLKLGDIQLGGSAGGAGGTSSLLTDAPANFNALASTAFSKLTNLSAAVSLPSSIASQVNTLFSGGTATDVQSIFFGGSSVDKLTKGSGIETTFPIINDARNILFRLLTGQDSDLITITAKISDLHLAGIEFPIPIVPPIFGKIRLGLTAELYAKLGLDTRGFRLAAADLANNVAPATALGKLSQSLYIDPDTKVSLGGEISLLGSVDIAIVTVNVGGTVGVGIGATIVTTGPDLDGDAKKVRPLGSISSDGTFVPGEVNAGHLIHLDGEVTVGLDFEVRVGVSIFSISFGVHPRITLFTFGGTDVDPIFTPEAVFGSVDSGVLNLNVGDRAYLRHANSGVADERLDIRQVDSGTVIVTAFGQSQTFTGVTSIVGDGGGGSDRFTVNTTDIPATLRGGDGNDVIQVTAPNALIEGGAGDDNLSLTARSGASRLNGGTGNDDITAYLAASGVAIVLDGGDDNDVLSININGATLGAASSILGGAGNDTANVTYPGGLPTIDLGSGGNDNLRLTAPGTAARNYVFGPSGLTIDGVALPNSNAEFITATAGDGNDTATFNNPATNVQFNGGYGNDVATVTSNSVGVNFYGGDGNDSLTAASSQGAINAFGGDGNDTFTLGDGALLNASGLQVRDFHASGGKGVDAFIINDASDTLSRTFTVTDTTDNSVTPAIDNGTLAIGSATNFDFHDLESIDLRTGSGNDAANIALTGTIPSVQTLNLSTGGGNDTVDFALNATIFNSASRIDLGAGDDTATVRGDSLAAASGSLVVEGSTGLDTLNLAGLFGPTLSFQNTGENAAATAGGLLDTLNVTATRAAHQIQFDVGVRNDLANNGYGQINLNHSAAGSSDAFNYQIDRDSYGRYGNGPMRVRAYTTQGGTDTDRVVIVAVNGVSNYGTYNYRTRVQGNDAPNEFHFRNNERSDFVTLDGGNGNDRFFVQNYYGGPDNYDILYGDYTLIGGAGNDRMDYDATRFNGYNASFDFFDNEIQFAGGQLGHVRTPAGDVEVQHFYGTNPGFGNGSNNYFLKLNGGGHGLAIFGGPSTEYFHVDAQNGFGDATLNGGGGNDQLLFDSGTYIPATANPINWTITESVLSRQVPSGIAMSSGTFTLSNIGRIQINDRYYGGVSNMRVSNTSASTLVELNLGYGDQPNIWNVTVGRADLPLRQATVGRILLSGDSYASKHYLILDDTANTAGATAFVDSTWIGARPTDTLIGNARYGLQVKYFATGTLNLGPGTDLVYLTQRPTSSYTMQWTVNGSGQLAGTNDQLVVGTTGYSVNGGSGATPSGYVSSPSEYGTVNYTGMESVTIDSQWVQILSSRFDRDGVRPALVLQLNNVDIQPLAIDGEDVYEQSRRAPFRVYSRTTNSDIPFPQLRSVVDNTAHTVRIEYLGNAAGIFPDGDYAALFGYFAIRSASGGIVAVNPNVAPYSAIDVDFRSLAGDANGDGRVNFDDLVTLAQHYNKGPGKYSEGDFNYDGTVNFDDLVILAQHYSGSPSSIAAVLNNTALATSVSAKDSKPKKTTPVKVTPAVSKPTPKKATKILQAKR